MKYSVSNPEMYTLNHSFDFPYSSDVPIEMAPKEQDLRDLHTTSLSKTCNSFNQGLILMKIQ